MMMLKKQSIIVWVISDMPQTLLWKYKNILLIVSVYCILACAYALTVPLWTPPDEIRHYAYCEYIAQKKALPYLVASQEGGHITQAVHPPLFYLLGSLFCVDDGRPIYESITINDDPNGYIISHREDERRFPFSGKARRAHLLRLFSIACGVITIFIIYKMTLLIFPGANVCASLAALFTATLPQFLHIAASVSNENLSTVLVTIYLYMLLLFLASDRRVLFSMGAALVLGGCLLSKSSTLFCVPLTVIVFAWKSYRDRKLYFGPLFIVLFGAAIVSGWWYVRNLVYYDDPLFTKALEALQPWSLRQSPISFNYVQEVISRTVVSFFGNFGSMQFPLKTSQLVVYLFLCVFAAAGLLGLSRQMKIKEYSWQALMLLGVSLCGGICFFILANMRYGMFMGRYFFVVMPAIAIPFAVGVTYFCSKLKQFHRFSSIVCMCVLVALSLDVFYRVVRPAYADFSYKKQVVQDSFFDLVGIGDKRTVISQSFTAVEDTVCGICCLFSRKADTLNGKLQFSIEDITGGNVLLYKGSMPLEDIKNFHMYYFLFPPIENSKGKVFTFSLETDEKNNASDVSLWYEPRDVYSRGSLTANGEKLEGDLFFSVYGMYQPAYAALFENDSIIFRHKPYINFREFQIYNEMTKEYRKSSVIQKKLDAVIKATGNVKSKKSGFD